MSKVTPAGVVSTFASGFHDPVGLAFDAGGDLYVANFNDGSGNNNGERGDARGGGQHLRLRVQRSQGLAFDAAGNLYVANGSNNPGAVSKVTPAGVVSTFASGFDLPPAWPSTAPATSSRRNSSNNTRNPEVSKVSETVTVPFTLGGSAVSGVAYSGVTASPLTFGIGQTTQNITGTLLSDPGPSQTLTFTLGTPTGGAALGSPSVNTLTITEPPLDGAVQHRQRDRERERRHRSAYRSRVSGTATDTVTVPFTLGGTAVVGHRLQRRHGQSADVRDRADHRRTSPARSSPTPAPARR